MIKKKKKNPKPEYDPYDPRSKTGYHETRQEFEDELKAWKKRNKKK